MSGRVIVVTAPIPCSLPELEDLSYQARKVFGADISKGIYPQVTAELDVDGREWIRFTTGGAEES